MSFKLLGIRPLEKCDLKFLNNLEKNKIYKFYNEYTFYHKSTELIDNEDLEIDRIKYNSVLPEKLYNQPNIDINISAIVGKNGSGKSSLVEFLLYNIFVLSNKFKYIDSELFLEERDNEMLYNANVKAIKKGFYGEFYYLIDNEISLIKISEDNISKIDFFQDSESMDFIKSDSLTNDLEKIKQILPFFFSIIINYSFYSFNSNIIGLWIKAFFNKNDGYQLPLVISPYRDRGNMDVNIELFLTTSRFMTNLITLKGYDYVNNKRIDKIFLGLNSNKDFTSIGDEHILNQRERLFKPLFNLMFNNEFNYPDVETGNDSFIKKYAEKYLDNKLRTIPRRYPAFSKYKDMISSNEDYDEMCLKFAKDLIYDKSHVTLKVKQTLNFLRENIFDYSDNSGAVILNISSIRNKIDSFRNNAWFTETIDFIPPPFLVPRILFEDGSYFHNLSSGEQQKVFSINSIIYHIKNLDSVFESLNDDLIKYENINLILDEIELYYHPEFQKDYINDLLNSIKEAKFKNIKNISIIFLTHSPFILSDIPKQNILFLEVDKDSKKAKSKSYDGDNTFGANIHEMLSTGFFMESTKGSFAISKINEFLEFYKRKDKLQKQEFIDKRYYFKNLISLIGEKYIRKILQNQFTELDEKFNPSYLEERQKELKNELDKIEKRIAKKSEDEKN